MAIVATAIVILLGALFALLEFVVFPTDRTASSELALLDLPKPDKRPFSQYDLVCFGFRQQDFADLKVLRYGECGQANSCCNIDSDGGVVIGLVKDGEVRCVQRNPFLSVLRDDRSFCTRPDTLMIEKRKYDKSDSQPPRYGITAPGSSYYVFGETPK